MHCPNEQPLNALIAVHLDNASLAHLLRTLDSCYVHAASRDLTWHWQDWRDQAPVCQLLVHVCC